MSFKKPEVKSKLKNYKLLSAISFFTTGLLCSYLFLTNPNSPSYILEPSVNITHEESLSVCFTPNESCLPKIVKEISNASSNILVLGYSFTSQPIALALIQAKQRGVNVKIVLDHSQKTQKYSKEIIQQLINSRIPVRFDHSVKIAHNKVVIIDDHLVMTGSYNFSHSAEYKNAENILFVKSTNLAKKYIDYFESRWIIANNFAQNHP